MGGHVEIHCVLQQLFGKLFPVERHLQGACDGFLPAVMAPNRFMAPEVATGGYMCS